MRNLGIEYSLIVSNSVWATILVVATILLGANWFIADWQRERASVKERDARVLDSDDQ